MHKLQVLPVAIVSVLAFLLVIPAAAAADEGPGLNGLKKKNIPVLKILAYSDFCGKYKALVSTTRANFDNGVDTFSIGAPDYKKLLILNPEDKRYTEADLVAWKEKMCPYRLPHALCVYDG